MIPANLNLNITWTKELFYAINCKPNEESNWYGLDSEENFYKNKTYKRGWTTTDINYKWNEYGFRSKSFSNLEEDKDKFRILVIGCSHTVGVGSKLEDSWPVILKNKIPNCVIYNLAQVSMSPDYCVRSVYKTIDIFNPHVVLVLWPDKSRFEWPTEDNQARFYIPTDDNYPVWLTDSYLQNYVFEKNQIFMQAICKHVQYYELYATDIIEEKDYSYGRDCHFGFEFHKRIAQYFLSKINY